MKDWYRRKTWTKIDQEEFFLKLNRARKNSRAQYLKIQAIELVETRDSKLLEVAENLLNQILAEYPDNRIEKGPVLHTLGDIYKIRKSYDKAISYYKAALDFEKIFPNVITEAYLDYSELVVKTNATNLFVDVEALLLKKEPNLTWPIEKYKVYSLLAIINKHHNQSEKTKHFSQLAEQNANAENSGFRYHKNLGVVNKRDEWLDREASPGPGE